jgi:hypothetical protein
LRSTIHGRLDLNLNRHFNLWARHLYNAGDLDLWTWDLNFDLAGYLYRFFLGARGEG